METLSFTYEPLALTRIFLQKYVEDFVQGKFYKAKQFAMYDFLYQMSDEELETILGNYVSASGVEFITFNDWSAECAAIFEQICKTEKYTKLEFDHKCKGYGITGLGVVDKSDNTFYDCPRVGHWQKVLEIVEFKYPEKLKPLRHFWTFEKEIEHAGFTREEIEHFIMNNFRLIGGGKLLNEYLGD
ncbi:hypothetical protein A3844_01780 [Paenibacillus helianthi]|uniref:Uncharacterized protein n=1 Tax=Paenibacillus helianthi TaxID=1349432 RepID=A0ABX3EUI9_9BACL|nr:hypothetical protein [Paenibacillus helianthi]OKP91868.1 hypothetical protein A3844_01780 [Paenibacillus helianthi]